MACQDCLPALPVVGLARLKLALIVCLLLEQTEHDVRACLRGCCLGVVGGLCSRLAMRCTNSRCQVVCFPVKFPDVSVPLHFSGEAGRHVDDDVMRGVRDAGRRQH